ncbi:MAG: carboxypeptidase-like regulatory domain-containing protein [Muribaculaceae bacterium]|nr:carboxypeptidase-like regulatory domain-containing protein [Muribaculaceae bacterium]
MNGKKTCDALRNIRQNIANVNGIEYTPAECTYQGDCPGTCPRCESEMRYIERQLRLRGALGKAVVVAGLTLSATSLTPMQAQTQQVDTVAQRQIDVPLIDAAPGDTAAITIRGTVIDRDDKEPLIGVTVLLDGTIHGTATNFDGKFAIRIPRDSKLIFAYVGYETQELMVKDSNNDLNVAMSLMRQMMGDVCAPIKMPDVDADIYRPNE